MAGAKARYRKKVRERMKPVKVEFFPPDSDIYDHLRKQSPMSGYIKELIRKDMQDAGNR